jgi:hypothetical protein
MTTGAASGPTPACSRSWRTLLRVGGVQEREEGEEVLKREVSVVRVEVRLDDGEDDRRRHCDVDDEEFDGLRRISSG